VAAVDRRAGSAHRRGRGYRRPVRRIGALDHHRPPSAFQLVAYHRRMADAPAVALFWGDDEFLVRQAALGLIEAQGLHAAEVEASEWQGGELFDLATPSLWGERRALLIAGCQHLPELGTREVRSYIEAPSPDALCVMTLISRGKSPALVKAVQASQGLVRQVVMKRQDLPKWIIERARVKGAQLAPAGA